MYINYSKQISSTRNASADILQGIRKNTPLASMKASFQRQIELEEAYRVKVLRNVATFCKYSNLHYDYLLIENIF
jgi:hypothetical protein